MVKYLIIVLLVLISCFGIYFQFTQNKIESLSSEIKTLEISNDINQKTIETMNVTFRENEERNRKLQTNLELAESSLQTLRKTLQEHDLTRLAAEKPGLIETRMQGSTNELFQNFFDFN